MHFTSYFCMLIWWLSSYPKNIHPLQLLWSTRRFKRIEQKKWKMSSFNPDNSKVLQEKSMKSARLLVILSDRSHLFFNSFIYICLNIFLKNCNTCHLVIIIIDKVTNPIKSSHIYSYWLIIKGDLNSNIRLKIEESID